MPFTEEELAAMRQADEEIEREFAANPYLAAKDHNDLAKELDRESVFAAMDAQQKRISEYKRKYNAEHKAEISEYMRKYNAEHKAEKAEYMRKYYAEHKEKIRRERAAET